MSVFISILFFVILLLLFFTFRKSRVRSEESLFLESNEEDKLLSEEEVFALALGDLEHERIASEIEELTLEAYLKKEWGLTFDEGREREHTLYALQKIWSKGTRYLLFENMQFEKMVSVSDTVAFDSARFSELIREAIYLGYLEEEEAWGLLFLNAERVQEAFSSSKEFINAYFSALVLFKFSKLEEEEKKSFEFDVELELLKSHSTVNIVWLEEELFSQFEIYKK